MASDTSPIYYYFLLNHFLRRWRMFSIFDGTVYSDFLRVKVRFREESERGHFSAFTGDEGGNFLWWRRRIGDEIQLTFLRGRGGKRRWCALHCAGLSGSRTAQPSAAASPAGWWVHHGTKTCIQGPAREGPSFFTQKHGETFLWRRRLWVGWC